MYLYCFQSYWQKNLEPGGKHPPVLIGLNRSYPTLKLGNKIAKTNPEKAQLFAESVERNFSIESHLFRKSHFDHIIKFVEAHSYHFTSLDSLRDNVTDTDDNSNLFGWYDPN